MSPRLVGVLCVLLAGAAGLQAHALVKPESGFATMPIFVAVSLEHERQMRAARELPVRLGGDEAIDLAGRLIAAPPEPALRPKIEALRDLRAKLLDARGRRHALDVRLMDLAVALASTLTPAQWEAIHMRRDALRARVDAEVFDRVLERMR